jgi:hypothetical protein
MGVRNEVDRVVRSKLRKIRGGLMARQSALPPTLPPRLIGREAAAAYVSVSPNIFDAMILVGTMPRPFPVHGRRVAWDVRDLDCCIDLLKERSKEVPQPDNDNSWSDVDCGALGKGDR